VQDRSSEFEETLQRGFLALPFPVGQERKFTAQSRLTQVERLRRGITQLSGLNLVLLGVDWMMVPDQFDQAWPLRLLLFAPLAWLTRHLIDQCADGVREWSAGLLLTVLGAITLSLSLWSQSALVETHILSLSLILLLNGTLLRLGFMRSLVVSCVLLLAFALTLLATHRIASPLSLAASLGLVGVRSLWWLLAGPGGARQLADGAT
jgi:hypothetical protein